MKRSNQVLLSISLILVVAWAFYQAIYSKFAPYSSVAWETTYYIIFFPSVASCFLFLPDKIFITKVLVAYLVAYLYICTARQIYFLRFIGDYESYEQSASSGWFIFKLVGSFFLGSAIYGLRQWQTNR